MAFHAGRAANQSFGVRGRWRGLQLAAWLASSALVLTPASPSLAQAAASVTTARQAVAFSIPAQPLAGAIKAFIRATGWQVGYPAGLFGNLRSNPVSGRLSPEAALRAMLAGSGIAVRMTGPETAALMDENAAAAIGDEAAGTMMETIVVEGKSRGVYLGTDSVSDTGTTTISGGQIVARSAGNDANDILRDLPNVQYQNDIDDDAGKSDQDVINLKPREVSISGARVYENNFILEGMPINTVTGTAEAYGSGELDDISTVAPPNADRMFGLHSQSIYVPTDFLEGATVMDSNVSAAFGDFQGGVVSYKMQQAAFDRWQGSVSTDYTTSRWTGYTVGTEDGLNPNDVASPDYLKRRSAISVTGPITDNIAILGQYSRQTAVTDKDKDYRYIGNDSVNEDASNEFYRAQIKADTDLGDFTLEGVYTDYSQIWESAMWRNMQVDQGATGLSTKLEHAYEFADFDLAGVALSNVKLNSRLSYGGSKSVNDMNGNVARAYSQTYFLSKVKRFEATSLSGISDWCRTDPSLTNSTICYDGATGDKEQGQDRLTFAQDLSGDIGQGKFTLGGEYSYTDAYRRRPEDAIYYGTYTTLNQTTTAGIKAFTCNTTEECNPEQFASNKIFYKAFDAHAHLNQFAAYGEVEQTWDWFNIRGGARVTYDDYMKNVDIAPRVVATITPWDDFAISVGANRYYDAQSLAYAIRDKQPIAQTYTRKQTGGVVGDTWTVTSARNYTNTASGLDTPYTDELTLGLSGIEPLSGGQWRLRFMDRRAKDQYATETSGTTRTLTNDGSGAYQSVTAEYSKLFDVAAGPLEQLLFNASVTWSRREVSNSNYYEDSFEDEYVYYKGQSYTLAGFSAVTGNMDIPVRFQAGISSSWFDNALTLDASANYNLGYTGARNTGDTITVDGRSHDVYEDFDFDPLLTVSLAASYQVYEQDHAGLSFNVRVDNVFDETGNATSTTNRPWLIGRTVWVGAKATF
jgi:hypothetical protein